MKRSKENVMREIIKLVPLEEPGRNFTAIVMNELVTESAAEVLADDKLKSAMETVQPDEVTAEFAYAVMSKVNGNRGLVPTKVPPIISTKGWVYVVVFITLLLLVGNFSNHGSRSSVDDLAPPMLGAFKKFIFNADFFSSIYFCVTCSVCILLIVDYGCKRLFDRDITK